MTTLTYRGITYSSDSAQQSTTNPPVTLTYRGVQYQTATQPAELRPYLLKYRGVAYTLGESAPVTKMAPAKAAPRRTEVATIHQQNLLKNLQHRIEVAQARGDEQLLKLLLVEREQIAA